MVELLFFADGGIVERVSARGERPSVGPMDKSMGMKDFQVLTNRNLRCFESA